MSQIARCCLCDQRVRIPDVDSDAWVRCPHCHEEYQLGKIANDLPPRMEVVGERSVVIDSGTVAPSVPIDDLPTEFPGVMEARANGESDAALVPMLVAADPPGPSEAEQSRKKNIRSPQNLHAHRVKNAARGGTTAVVKVALGGLAGLMLGQFILWWLPVPYQSDPFQLAQKMPAGLQFLLPPNFKNPVDEALTEGPEDMEAPTVSLEPVVEPTMPGDGKSDPQGISGGQPVPPTDLKYSLQTAVSEDSLFSGRSVHETKHVETWYGGLSQLAFCVTNISAIDGVNAEVVDDMSRFLLKLVHDPQKVASITKMATRQLAADPPRNQKGILLAGTVEKIRPAGELFRTTLRMSETEKVVEVISRSDPRLSKTFNENDFLLLLGVVLTQPMELEGYKGENRPVVFGGFPVRAGKSNVEIIEPSSRLAPISGNAADES